MTNAVFEPDVIDKMQGDIALLASPRMCKSMYRKIAPGEVLKWKEQILWDKKFQIPEADKFTKKDDGSVVWETAGGSICPDGGYFFDWAGDINANSGFYDDMELCDIPSPDHFNPGGDLPEQLLRDLENAAKFLYENTDLSICVGETVTDLQIKPGGMVKSMILMKQYPEIMREFLYKCTVSALSQLKQLDQAVGKYADILSIADDIGDNRGVLIGADLWREIYKKPYFDLFSDWKKITNMKINLHTCGSVYNIMDDLIECGADIINPVQISARNMSAENLKKEFGNKIVFWGGAYDAQLFGSGEAYEEVYKKVSDAVRVLKQDGGFIFSGVHNLPPDMPQHHLKAMLDAWRDNRDY
jgi:uroporphyrinogen decarboxylase